MRKIFTTCFFLFGQLAYGQVIHEVKADVFLPFFQTIHVSYEIVPKGRLGVEIDFFHQWFEDNLGVPSSTPSPEPIPQFTYYKKGNAHLTLAAKYYLFKKHAGAGLYAGVYLHEVFESYREKKYWQDYYALSGKPAPDPEKQLHFGLGLLAGYKWLIAKRFLVEPSVGMDYGQTYQNVYIPSQREWWGIPAIKLGYRLSALD